MQNSPAQNVGIELLQVVDLGMLVLYSLHPQAFMLSILLQDHREAEISSIPGGSPI